MFLVHVLEVFAGCHVSLSAERIVAIGTTVAMLITAAGWGNETQQPEVCEAWQDQLTRCQSQAIHDADACWERVEAARR